VRLWLCTAEIYCDNLLVLQYKPMSFVEAGDDSRTVDIKETGG